MAEKPTDIETMSPAEKEKKVNELLTRGVVEVADMEHLKSRLLEKGTVLRVKLGIDPTGSRLHIGRGSTLLKLKEFQDLGHTIVIVIGDGTAQIGDSSDKTGARTGLTPEQISHNIADYMEQFARVLDVTKLEVVHNAEWLSNIPLETILKLGSTQTLQQATQRSNFANRIGRGDPVSFTEALYPLFQAYDSVMINADVELGGEDQTYNLAKGRDVQRAYGQEPQDYITTKLLIGPNGEKMSTSIGNCIWINDSPEKKYTDLMKVADSLVPVYFECSTRLPMDYVNSLLEDLESKKIDIVSVKKILAREVVRLYDGEDAALKAEDYFSRVVQQKELPESALTRVIAPGEISLDFIISLLKETNLVSSKGEAKRLIIQNGITIDGETITLDTKSINLVKGGSFTIRVGSRSLKILRVEASAD